MVVTPLGVRFRGQIYPCVIGRGGLRRNKREGDGGTPLGAHLIVDLYYRPDRLPPPNAWAKPIRPGDLWSDDPARAEYNHLVRRPYSGSHEVMRRADPMYDLVLITDWNYPRATPGQGSCIFLHQWRFSPRSPARHCGPSYARGASDCPASCGWPRSPWLMSRVALTPRHAKRSLRSRRHLGL